jgi:hypothetical protein
MNTLAFIIGLGISAVGALGLVAPAFLIWIAQRFAAPGEWLVLGVVRIAVGLLLLSVAKTSRTPRALRVVAFIPLLAGVAALATPFVGLERAVAAVEWWSRQSPTVARFTAVPILALGAFIAYASWPAHRVTHS